MYPLCHQQNSYLPQTHSAHFQRQSANYSQLHSDGFGNFLRLYKRIYTSLPSFVVRVKKSLSLNHLPPFLAQTLYQRNLLIWSYQLTIMGKTVSLSCPFKYQEVPPPTPGSRSPPPPSPRGYEGPFFLSGRPWTETKHAKKCPNRSSRIKM